MAEEQTYEKTTLNPEETLLMGKQEVRQDRPAFMYEPVNEDQTSKITIDQCKLPQNASGKVAYVLHNVFSKTECDEIINWCQDNLEYTPAMLNAGKGRQILHLEARKHDRAIFDTVDMTDYIFQRIKKFLPQCWGYGDKPLACLNERLRFLRYEPGCYFAPHWDGTYRRDDDSELSYHTILFYLNDDYVGGHTNFLANNLDPYPVKIKAGSILVFQHDIYHEGALLESGQKHIMRTDVMYSRWGSEPSPIINSSDDGDQQTFTNVVERESNEGYINIQDIDFDEDVVKLTDVQSDSW